MNFRSVVASFAIASILLVGCSGTKETTSAKPVSESEKSLQVIEFPSDKYPETAKHIKDAIAAGKTDICTVDRNGAAERRKQSLAHTPTKKGYDRDEYPLAVCVEGGAGADIRYIPPADNRGAGSYIGNKLDKVSDGTKVKLVVK
ncbi:TPA: sporulation protein [Bacillus pseudomycoides]|nr:sporulation protein [Bacillus pseudomycoides]